LAHHPAVVEAMGQDVKHALRRVKALETRIMTGDLSTHHQPIGDLFKSPESAADWDRFRLSSEHIEFYKTNGYLAGIRLLKNDQVEVLRAELDQLINPVSDAPLNRPARLGRRTVRKGSAFPTLALFLF